ncbi:hypothetical protein [Streptosporangium sp. NPDC006007]|uniref:hypothetical protein n=1 Tax=Streptosporangium sp. NPDC006007 TaxID=3154575 RepID=UPI0033A7C845
MDCRGKVTSFRPLIPGRRGTIDADLHARMGDVRPLLGGDTVMWELGDGSAGHVDPPRLLHEGHLTDFPAITTAVVID